MWSETRRSEFPVWPECQVHQEEKGKSVLDRGLVIYVKCSEKCFGSLCFREHLVIFLGYIGPERVKSKTMYTTCRFLFFKIMVPSGRFRLHCLFTSYTSKPQEVVFCSKIFRRLWLSIFVHRFHKLGWPRFISSPRLLEVHSPARRWR